MTCDEFDMNCHYALYDKSHEWDVSMRDGDTKISFSVPDDMMQECIDNNFDYVIDTVAENINERVVNMNDLGQITDEEKAVFDKILFKVIA